MMNKEVLTNKVILGDIREVSSLILDNFVQSTITSPPTKWGI